MWKKFNFAEQSQEGFQEFSDYFYLKICYMYIYVYQKFYFSTVFKIISGVGSVQIRSSFIRNAF